jgi:hypothetical protein
MKSAELLWETDPEGAGVGIIISLTIVGLLCMKRYRTLWFFACSWSLVQVIKWSCGLVMPSPVMLSFVFLLLAALLAFLGM